MVLFVLFLIWISIGCGSSPIIDDSDDMTFARMILFLRSVLLGPIPLLVGLFRTKSSA
jgi:hypothetical protein